MHTGSRLCMLCGRSGELVEAARAQGNRIVTVLLVAAKAELVLCSDCVAGQLPSPCISLCTLDAQREACRGCGRSVLEITRWRDMAAEDRALVLLRLRSSH
jgi:uncharacterized protein